jgi:hypothetical protein
MCAHRVQNHIAADFKKMAVLLDKNGLVPALEEMAGSAMALVICLGVDAIQLTHPQGEISLRRLDKQMIMIVHQAVGMADPVIAFIDMSEDNDEGFPVALVLEDILLLVPSGSNVIDGARIFDS